MNFLAAFISENGVSANTIVDYCLAIVLLVLINYFVFHFIKRKFVIFTVLTCSIGYAFCKFFLLDSSALIFFIVGIVIALYALFVNMAETRYLFANKLYKQKVNVGKKGSPEIEKVFDHENFYKTINDTVLYLSKNKIGALITFERKDKLKDIIKNGSYLYAPVTFELLITIFYPGTRLHDGAVVINGDKIVAASVYYTPTTKPLTGKYGSRHRAAIGISEICDAVTVVVSEETGRISIAYNGQIESYHPDNFYVAFVNIMSETDLSNEENESK